ncbi:YhbY family RNA-binding protein [Eubacteriaceae bacterium ES2]|nr:YhbY family RNA-binding protein [Eubacteriaceae bacterium ES2]
MLTSKQRNYLRKLAAGQPDIIYVGKEGITDTLIDQTRAAVIARELIKGKVQKNALVDADQAGRELAEAIKAELVCTIGSKFVLYKKNLLKTRIEVPSKNTKPIKRIKKKSSGRLNKR